MQTILSGKKNKKLYTASLTATGALPPNNMFVNGYYSNEYYSPNSTFMASPNGKYIFCINYNNVYNDQSNYNIVPTSSNWLYSTNYGKTFTAIILTGAGQYNPSSTYGIAAPGAYNSNISNTGMFYYSTNTNNGNGTLYRLDLNTNTTTSMGTFASGGTNNGQLGSSVSADGTTIFVTIYEASNSALNSVKYWVSTNSGSSFTAYSITGFTTAQSVPNDVLISENGQNIFWLNRVQASGGGYFWRYSTNYGATFSIATGLPTNIDLYGSNNMSGKCITLSDFLNNVYYSTNYGASFTTQSLTAFPLGSNGGSNRVFRGVASEPYQTYNSRDTTIGTYMDYNNFNVYNYAGSTSNRIMFKQSFKQNNYAYTDIFSSLSAGQCAFVPAGQTNYCYVAEFLYSRANTSSLFSGTFNLYRKYLR